MFYQTINPPGHLAHFVRFFWVLEGGKDNQPFHYRSMADGSAEMIFHYHGPFDEISDHGIETGDVAMLHAQSRKFRRFVTAGSFGIFGIYLYPFAIPQLFNLPAHAVSSEMPDFDALLGSVGKQLTEQIILASTTDERVAIAVRFLEQQLTRYYKPQNGIDHIIKQIIHRQHHVPISQLAGEAFLSTRQFERKFKEYAGFNPKLFLRIARFQKTLKWLNHNPTAISEVAYNCGYYDQSHFIHEFKEFYGYHPTTYFSGLAEGSEYQLA